VNAVVSTDKATPEWNGATVVCIASGPSLTREDVEVVRQKNSAGKCKVIAVNREFETAPWAEVMFAADYRFWLEYHGDISREFLGEKWTIDQQAAKRFKLNYIGRNWGQGFSRSPGLINTGGNSGYQAVHLAASWGASRIFLLGYDMKSTNGRHHHYGAHRNGLANGKGFNLWIASFKPLVIDLKKMKVELLNLTRESDLPDVWIPRSTVESAPW
jgi:hypothetical protein